MSEARIDAPFTFEQVVALNEYQRGGWFHPFTCGNREDHPVVDGDKGILIATVRGWVCTFCDYTQSWAHQFMVAGPPSWMRSEPVEAEAE